MDTSDKWTLSWRNGTELHSRQITKYMKEKAFCYWKFVFLQKSKICQRNLVFLPIEPQSKFSIVVTDTAQKMKFSIKYFFSKCDQICSRLRIWSHLMKKSLMKNFIFCAVRILIHHLLHLLHINVHPWEMCTDYYVKQVVPFFSISGNLQIYKFKGNW